MIAALATFINPGVGCSARNPPGQGKAHHENDNPLHAWIYAQLMSHKKPPEPGQVPCDSAFLAVQFQNVEFEIGVAFQRRGWLSRGLSHGRSKHDFRSGGRQVQTLGQHGRWAERPCVPKAQRVGSHSCGSPIRYSWRKASPTSRRGGEEWADADTGKKHARHPAALLKRTDGIGP